MKAIYQGKLYQMGDNLAQVELIDEEADGIHGTIVVPWGDPELIVDPTDDQINNILPDYQHDPSEALGATTSQAQSLDQIVGCNVHGRLTCILALLDSGDLPTVRLELNRLLAFFPKP